MRENAYQAKLVRRLRSEFPGCVIVKNDSAGQQGILDLTILWGDRWGMLEVKAHVNASVRPNQKYWVDTLNSMSFAAFICPENEEEVLRELHQAFEPYRATLVLGS